MCLMRFAFSISLMLIISLAILTRSVFVIRTTCFSHPHQCVPLHRLKSAALNFHVHVHVQIGSSKTESGAE